MATTNLLAIHLRLSRKLHDSVTLETTDGKKVTALQRDTYINQAIREMERTLYVKLGKEKVSEVLQSHVATSALTWTSGYSALPADDIRLPLFLANSTYGIYTYHPVKQELDKLTNEVYKYSWTISGGNIYGYQDGAVATTSATYYYLKKDEGVNNTTDVAVTAIYYDLVVELALADILLERNEISAQEWSAMKTNAFARFI